MIPHTSEGFGGVSVGPTPRPLGQFLLGKVRNAPQLGQTPQGNLHHVRKAIKEVADELPGLGA